MTTSEQYESRTCRSCNGTGKRYDITCADKVDTTPDSHRCSTCRGEGRTEHLVAAHLMQAPVVRKIEPLSETPDWMLA